MMREGGGRRRGTIYDDMRGECCYTLYDLIWNI